jgi:hypothetical protein
MGYGYTYLAFPRQAGITRSGSTGIGKTDLWLNTGCPDMGELWIQLPDGRWGNLVTREIRNDDPFGPDICDDLSGWKPPYGVGRYQDV